MEWQDRLESNSVREQILSDTEMKYGAPKSEILGSEPFKLRVDNRALS